MKPKNKHHSELIPVEEQKMIDVGHENHAHDAIAVVTNPTPKSSQEAQPAQQETAVNEQVNIQSNATGKDETTEIVSEPAVSEQIVSEPAASEQIVSEPAVSEPVITEQAPNENDNTQTQQQEETVNKELEQIWAEGSEHLLKENKK